MYPWGCSFSCSSSWPRSAKPLDFVIAGDWFPLCLLYYYDADFEKITKLYIELFANSLVLFYFLHRLTTFFTLLSCQSLPVCVSLPFFRFLLLSPAVRYTSMLTMPQTRQKDPRVKPFDPEDDVVTFVKKKQDRQGWFTVQSAGDKGILLWMCVCLMPDQDSQ